MTQPLMFQRAERKKSKLRLALTGPSGSGKTYSALLIAKGIGGKTAVIDTEKGSASLYADRVHEFDAVDLEPPYSPERFIEAMAAAEAGGYEVLIIDSITHEWSGVGGCLELVDEVARAKFQGNTWSAWSHITPRHRAFIDAILRSPLHVIATVRSKTETAQQDGPNGKKKVVKLGMKAETRDGAEYEFTTVLDLIHDGHFAVASKDRTGLFSGDPKPITEQTGRDLLAFLNTGTLPAEQEIYMSLRKAAVAGTAKLTEAHEELKSRPDYRKVWAQYGAQLKEHAARSDERIKKDEEESAKEVRNDEEAQKALRVAA